MEVTQVLKKEMERKIGLDLDLDLEKDKDLKILTTFFNALYLFRDCKDLKVRVYHSSSGCGYHLEFESEKFKELTDIEKWKIREILGDCEGRLRYAEMRGYDDVLFDFKLHDNEMKSRYEITFETLIYRNYQNVTSIKK